MCCNYVRVVCVGVLVLSCSCIVVVSMTRTLFLLSSSGQHTLPMMRVGSNFTVDKTQEPENSNHDVVISIAIVLWRLWSRKCVKIDYCLVVFHDLMALCPLEPAPMMYNIHAPFLHYTYDGTHSAAVTTIHHSQLHATFKTKHRWL